ncbi:Uncharacterised protein [Streptococcus dysgalactiae subsp. equisimilis]|nr:Uncharacterised protein [Streptococcus dysgalactiae subsp. equisimilis]SQF77255.1 Uncharacterised protein [Streptococcus dysgalactiae subsp. equisimilis]
MLKDFEIYSNKNLSNQVLRKLVKLASSQNVNYQRYINVSGHSRFLSWVSFFCLKFKSFSENFPEITLIAFLSFDRQFHLAFVQLYLSY